MKTQIVSALPQVVDIGLYRGDDFFIDIEIFEPTGEATDLSSVEVLAQIRDSPDSDLVIAVFDSVIEDNVIHLHLTSAESTKLILEANWDCQTDTNGLIQTHARGKISPTLDVSRV